MFEKKVTDEEKKRLEKVRKKEEKEKKKQLKGESDSKAEKTLSIVKTLAITTLVAGIIVCLIYVVIDSKVEAEELKTKVVCMRKSVEANTLITPELIDDYFTVISVQTEAVSENVYKSLSELPEGEFYVENAMTSAQMVYKDDIATTDEVMDKYMEGYEITSFETPDYVGGVNGSLRKGDIVDVYAVDPATDMLVLMAENVYIREVYDASGNKITNAEETAVSFTVYVTPQEVEQINMAICYGGIQMYLKVE